MQTPESRKAVYGTLAAYIAIAWLTLGERRIFERLWFEQPVNFGFVLANVQGVLDGHPVSKSWQQRFLAPAGVAALDSWTGDRLESLKLFLALAALAANLLLYHLMLRKGATRASTLGCVIGFGFARFLLAYKLEYPWDEIDILLFMLFGAWIARGKPLLPLGPLLLIGALNHETILYMPLFYLLVPFAELGRGSKELGVTASMNTDADQPRRAVRRDALYALLYSLVLGGAILWLRDRFYVGSPNLPGTTAEQVTPVISNHLHIEHNLRQLFIADWKEGRSFMSSGFLLALGGLGWLITRRARLAPALWTLCVMATIVCFGYINETRHYLLLLAFWCAYALPP